ncbi:hypothetical protein CNMCM6805_003676 [Aspergillus fumigatiaffinis]|uniref:Fatty acid desaturase domain-containing protein n=1 Tax=Aspergillus fumigatiaffinis TaxID=340414 RepID=A0A8H4GRW4_9EURO|nr:hypothetical protein CNMCM6805_003676 [Aspergillus fumigatiaffinis]
MQGPIRWWAREHRVHHRYTDTPDDPYNIKKGFLHAHILWMLVKQPKRAARVDISDLKADTVVVWQERNYVPLALLMGWGFPAALAGLCWNDWYGGLLYAGILRMFVTHQGVFCINSVCHYLGDQPYDDRLSPRNLPHVLALFTLGEGYHNFHHEFPSDYRNGVHWYDLDSTKWAIWVWEKLGLVRDLKRFRQNEIEKARLQQLQKVLNKRELQLQWGPSLKKLPVMDWKELKMQVETGRELGLPYVKRKQWSAIAFLNWKQECSAAGTSVSGLKAVIRVSIANTVAGNVIAQVTRGQTIGGYRKPQSRRAKLQCSSSDSEWERRGMAAHRPQGTDGNQDHCFYLAVPGQTHSVVTQH